MLVPNKDLLLRILSHTGLQAVVLEVQEMADQVLCTCRTYMKEWRMQPIHSVYAFFI